MLTRKLPPIQIWAEFEAKPSWAQTFIKQFVFSSNISIRTLSCIISQTTNKSCLNYDKHEGKLDYDEIEFMLLHLFNVLTWSALLLLSKSTAIKRYERELKTPIKLIRAMSHASVKAKPEQSVRRWMQIAYPTLMMTSSMYVSFYLLRRNSENDDVTSSDSRQWENEEDTRVSCWSFN